MAIGVELLTVAWLISALRRAGRRVAAHRGEAASVFGFVVLLAVGVRLLGLAPRMGGMLNAHVAAGVPASLALAMTLAWLPLMIIDMKR